MPWNHPLYSQPVKAGPPEWRRRPNLLAEDAPPTVAVWSGPDGLGEPALHAMFASIDETLHLAIKSQWHAFFGAHATGVLVGAAALAASTSDRERPRRQILMRSAPRLNAPRTRPRIGATPPPSQQASPGASRPTSAVSRARGVIRVSVSRSKSKGPSASEAEDGGAGGSGAVPVRDEEPDEALPPALLSPPVARGSSPSPHSSLLPSSSRQELMDIRNPSMGFHG